MQKTDIGWCEYTHNPLTGCLHDCKYCYAKPIAVRFTQGKDSKVFPYRFAPTLYPHRFETKTPKSPSRIFLCSMADPCGAWDWTEVGTGKIIPREKAQGKLWEYAGSHPEHQFVVLSKAPQGLMIFEEPAADVTFGSLPDNLIFGATVEGNEPVHRRRLETLQELQEKGVSQKVVISHEPAFDPLPPLWKVKPGTGWLIIGDQTGRMNFEKMSATQAVAEMKVAQSLGWTVFIKDTIRARVPGVEWSQDYLAMPEPVTTLF